MSFFIALYNNANNNEENNNNTIDNNQETDDYNELKTIKTYAGCSKELYQSSIVNFQYVKYVLEVKEANKCVLHYGGVDASSSGSIMLPFNCDTANSYITVTNSEIPMFFKVNSNDTITYQNANIIMRKVDSPQDANYNFCKNNY